MKFLITEEEKDRILGMHKEATKNHYIISEQSVPLLTVLANPANVTIANEPEKGSNVVYISQLDANGKMIPGSKYSYKVRGSYDPGAVLPNVNFEVNLRNVKRLVNGVLMGQAQPSGGFMQKTMKALVPKANQTSDGWLPFAVSGQQLNDGLTKLKNQGGGEVKISAGNGVSILLTKIP